MTNTSLSQAVHFSSVDVMQIAPTLALQPEDIHIGKYTFLSWVRSGFAAGLSDPPAGLVRAQLDVSIDVVDDAGSKPITVSKTLAVRGPGDVLDFDTSQIVRRYPEPGTPNAEMTFLAHVEFDRPEFPWLFSPFTAKGDQIAPWIALVVLEKSHAFINRGASGLPLVVKTRYGELQPLEDSWAWAHAQVIGGSTDPGPSVADRLTDAYGPVNLSRLLCPRLLSPNTSYLACVVPAFDIGVKAGLGQSGGVLSPAWTRSPGDEDHEIVLPVYDHWTFATTTDGDFHSLAERLKGAPAPWSVGRRSLDTSHPRGGVADLGPGDPGSVQVIKCALVSPSTDKPNGAPDEDAAWSAPKTEELRTQINLADPLSKDDPAAIPDLPLIGPTIYAQYQRGESRVTEAPGGDWFPELNLLPTRRVVAGLGTRVVQRDREELMQAAWAQVGDVEGTNRDLRRAQFARFVGASLHGRHYSALSAGQLAQVTRGLQGKIRLVGSALTVAGTVANSAVAPAALTPAFRRASCSGPLARYATGANLTSLQQMVAAGSVYRDFRRTYVEPEGVGTLSPSAIAAVSPAVAAEVLGVPQPDALSEVSKRVAAVSGMPSAADQLLSDPSTWKPASATFDIGAIAAEQTLATVNFFMPKKVSAEPSRAEGLAFLLTGIANSRTPAAKAAEKKVATISKGLPAFEPAAAPAAAPPVPGTLKRFDSVASRQVGLALVAPRMVPAAEFTLSLSQFVRGIGTSALPALTPSRPPLVLPRDAFLTAVHPRTTVTAVVKARIGTFPPWLAKDWFDDGLVRPIMVAPVFKRPMYEALDDYDRNWLIPGLGDIAATDFVTMLLTNPVFTEAFLAGLSDEMGHELLFRGFPTDQRGTYFRRFWNADADDLIQDLYRFDHTPLGTHLAGGQKQYLVFLVRGELIRRYPNALAFAIQALPLKPGDDHPTFIDPGAYKGALAPHLFPPAFLAPDILLVGSQLTEADLTPQKWWFVIAEHPTAPRFGPLPDFQEPQNSWPPGFMPLDLPANPNAGAAAQTLLRNPARAAFEASKLVASAKA